MLVQMLTRPPVAFMNTHYWMQQKGLHQSAIQYVAENENMEMVQILLKAGTCVNRFLIEDDEYNLLLAIPKVSP